MQVNRRPEKALSPTSARQALPVGKHFDGHGLYLRVQGNGSRRWVQRIVIRGKRCELGLGSPPVVTLAAARELALENRRVARTGGDPLLQKRRAQAVLTFEQAARKVHEIHQPTWRNEKHGKDFINSLSSYAFPKLGSLKVSEISAADVLAVLTPIWTSTPETARRVRQRIGTVLKWAISQDWRQDNPAENIGQALPKHERSQVHRVALPYSGVTECIRAVRESRARDCTKLALEFLVLTACRSGEVRHALWEEIDVGAPATSGATARPPVWEIPAARMKMKRAHRIPLSARALEILEAARASADKSGLVFHSDAGKALSDMTLSKLVKELGFKADVHGFRTSFRTWTQEATSFPREVAEAALAHATGDAVEAAYARSDLFEKRRSMMEAWAAYLSDKQAVPGQLALVP